MTVFSLVSVVGFLACIGAWMYAGHLSRAKGASETKARVLLFCGLSAVVGILCLGVTLGIAAR